MSQNLQEALAQELLDVSYANRCNAHIRNGLPGTPARNRVRDLGYFDVVTPGDTIAAAPSAASAAVKPALLPSAASRMLGPALAALGIAGAGAAGYALAPRNEPAPPAAAKANGDEGLIEYFAKKGLNVWGRAE